MVATLTVEMTGAGVRDARTGLFNLDSIIAKPERALTTSASAKNERDVKQLSTAKHLTHSS
jgi:hypothetical protein